MQEPAHIHSTAAAQCSLKGSIEQSFSICRLCLHAHDFLNQFVLVNFLSLVRLYQPPVIVRLTQVFPFHCPPQRMIEATRI